MQGIRRGNLAARAEVVKRGRAVAFVQGKVTERDGGTPLSSTQASFAIIPEEKTALVGNKLPEH